jgi:hypothetical protein
MTRIRLLTMLVMVLLAGCVATPNGLSNLSDEQAFSLARKRVSENLKDPYSAQFGVQLVRKTHQLGAEFDRVCGTVNAKNSLGAYTGMQIFSYNLVNDVVVMGDNAKINCVL